MPVSSLYLPRLTLLLLQLHPEAREEQTEQHSAFSYELCAETTIADVTIEADS